MLKQFATHGNLKKNTKFFNEQVRIKEIQNAKYGNNPYLKEKKWLILKSTT
jgi:hypothetical protein